MKDKNLKEIIGIAIKREEEAYAFYRDLFNRVQDKTAQETLEFLAGEEKKHREFLIRYRDGGYETIALRMNTIVDYHIAEHLEKPDLDKNMESKDVYRGSTS